VVNTVAIPPAIPPLALIVGGDAPTQAVVRFLLAADGYRMVTVVDPADPAIPREDPTLCVVAASFDTPDPTPALASLHRTGYRGPLVLLARSLDSALRRRAFALGARDVVGLPVAPAVLRARLRAVVPVPMCAVAPPAVPMCAVAPPTTPAPAALRAGGLTFDPTARTVDDGRGWTAQLTRHEGLVLAALMRAPGHPQGRHDLLDQVWGEGYEGDGNTLEVYVRRLRAKLARPAVPHGYVHTARGQGYAFEARRAPRPAAPASLAHAVGHP